MWDYMSGVTSEPSWLPLALERGAAVLATDGSYDRKRGLNVSGAGWVIACQRSGNILKGSFFEFSSNASSYRGYFLSLVAIHTLVLHACQFYQPTIVTGKIICDSKLALYKSSEKGPRRIRPGVAQADLFQALQSIHQETLGVNLHYKWVKSHQDFQVPLASPNIQRATKHNVQYVSKQGGGTSSRGTNISNGALITAL
jgi:hypothetical protein